MVKKLIEIHNSLADIVQELNSLGFDDNRSAVQSIVDAMCSVEDYIEEANTEESK